MKNINTDKLLIFGIGNAARGDDGLGWAFLDALKKRNDLQGHLAYRYQLNLEDVALLPEAHPVVFVDATMMQIPLGYRWAPALPTGEELGYSSHSLSPMALLSLSEELYGRVPPAFLLLISGESWELGEGLSARAERGLEGALQFFQNRLHHPRVIPMYINQRPTGS